MRGAELKVRAVAVLAALLLLAPTLPAAAAAPTASGASQFTTMLNALPVRAERPRGYVREKFADWVTQPNGCDTRETILINEARTGHAVRCEMFGGSWLSVYDGRTITNPSSLDIDHVVPLEDAWASGARNWTKAKRASYSNDLGYADSLIAVSASTNRSKGDRDPAGWLPRKADQCRYVQAWIAVKWRWRLTVNLAEKRAIQRVLTGCDRRLVPLPRRA